MAVYFATAPHLETGAHTLAFFVDFDTAAAYVRAGDVAPGFLGSTHVVWLLRLDDASGKFEMEDVTEVDSARLARLERYDFEGFNTARLRDITLEERAKIPERLVVSLCPFADNFPDDKLFPEAYEVYLDEAAFLRNYPPCAGWEEKWDLTRPLEERAALAYVYEWYVRHGRCGPDPTVDDVLGFTDEDEELVYGYVLDRAPQTNAEWEKLAFRGPTCACDLDTLVRKLSRGQIAAVLCMP